MKCENCGMENSAGAVFCSSCGKKLEVAKLYCKNCGEQLKSDAQFCGKCGTKVMTAPVAADRGCAPSSFVAPDSNNSIRLINFGEAVGNFFSKYVDFKGRATRAEYWWILLFNFIMEFCLSLFAIESAEASEVLLSIYFLFILIPTLSLCWRRLHDIGKSGGYYFFVLIPVVGVIMLIVFMLTESDGDNRYGPRKSIDEYNSSRGL